MTIIDADGQETPRPRNGGIWVRNNWAIVGTFIVLLGALIGFYTRVAVMENKVTTMQADVTEMKKDLKEFTRTWQAPR